MAVRSALPWPLRWFLLALMLGSPQHWRCGLLSLGAPLPGWMQEAEKNSHLRAEVQRLQDESQRHQALVDTSGSLLLAERTALEQLTARLRQAEAENRSLREDLGLFEKLSRLAPTPTASPSEAFRLKSLQECICDGKHS
jgi:hypothetical protein